MKKHFKVLTCITMSICLLVACVMTESTASAAGAISANDTDQKDTITFDDGSYCIVTTTETTLPSVARGTTHTKQAKKSYKYYNSSDVLCWTYTLHGTFMYDDYLVVCSDVSHSIAIDRPDHWVYDGGKRWKQGNTAYGTATFSLIGFSAKKTAKLQISCTKHGVIS